MTKRSEAYTRILKSLDEILSYLDSQPRDFESNALTIELETLKLELERREEARRWLRDGV